jgi:hypothetical protein|tara:strand:+ start:1736 stop:1918 length:183 start_codon:yes stop_codon:yes gene_type:complete
MTDSDDLISWFSLYTMLPIPLGSLAGYTDGVKTLMVLKAAMIACPPLEGTPYSALASSMV